MRRQGYAARARASTQTRTGTFKEANIPLGGAKRSYSLMRYLLNRSFRRREDPSPVNLADSLPVVSTRHFNRDGGGLAAANAKRRRAAFQPIFLQGRKQRHDDSGPRRADRMAERAGAAMHIDLFMRDTEFPHRGHGDYREGLVDLEKIDIRQGPAGLDHQFSQRLDGGGGELTGRPRVRGMSQDRRHGRDAPLFGLGAAHENERCGSVRNRTRIRRRHAAAFPERRFEMRNFIALRL